MAAKKKAKAVKVRKKKWMPVVAPKLFNNNVLGETHIGEDEEVLRKSITLNLSTVMSDMRKQGYLVRFDMVKVHEGKALTALTALTMTPSGVKRLIRRGRTKVEDSFLARLKDGRVVRVKPLVVTLNRCSKPAASAIRAGIKEKVKTVLAESTLDAFVNEILTNKIQRVLKEIANKSHPARSADIKAIQLLPKHKEGLGEGEELELEEKSEEAKPAKEEKADEKAEEAPKKVAKKAAKKAVKKAAKKTAEPTEEKSEEKPAEEAPAKEEKAEPAKSE